MLQTRESIILSYYVVKKKPQQTRYKKTIMTYIKQRTICSYIFSKKNVLEKQNLKNATIIKVFKIIMLGRISAVYRMLRYFDMNIFLLIIHHVI